MHPLSTARGDTWHASCTARRATWHALLTRFPPLPPPKNPPPSTQVPLALLRLGRSLPVNEQASAVYTAANGVRRMGSETNLVDLSGMSIDSGTPRLPSVVAARPADFGGGRSIATVTGGDGTAPVTSNANGSAHGSSGSDEREEDKALMPADFGGRQIALDLIADPRLETKLNDWQVVRRLPAPLLLPRDPPLSTTP